MTITIRPRWSLGRGKTLVPSRWQATGESGHARTDSVVWSTPSGEQWTAGVSDGKKAARRGRSRSENPWTTFGTLRRSTLAAAAVGQPLTAVGAVVTLEEEKSMAKHQQYMKGVVFRAASSATLMAVVVVVVGAGKKFT